LASPAKCYRPYRDFARDKAFVDRRLIAAGIVLSSLRDFPISLSSPYRD
jgi:hypothetical protein